MNSFCFIETRYHDQVDLICKNAGVKEGGKNPSDTVSSLTNTQL